MNSNHLFHVCKCSLTIILALMFLQTKAWDVKEAPYDMLNYAGLVGKQFCFKVTGFNPVDGADRFWGDLIYTSDSPIQTTSVYEGWVAPLGTAQVIIEVIPGQNIYNKSTRNSITGISYVAWSLSYSYVDYCCNDGQYNAYHNPTCSACQTGCLLCSGTADNCQACARGYGLYGSECRECVGTNYVGPTEPCSFCQVGCHDCDEQNRSICLACDTGYTLNGGKCSECPAGKTNNGGTDSTCELNCSDHCLLCEGPNLCTRCSTGYFLNQTDTGVECGSCPDNCDLCNNATVCLTCSDGFVVSSDKCRQCGIGSFSDGHTCVGCSDEKCIKCESTDVCEACFNGYLVSSDKKTCVLDPKGTGFPTQAIIFLTIIAAGVFGGAVIITWQYLFRHITKHKLQ